MCKCNRTIFIWYPSLSTNILVLLLFIPIVTAWWWPLSLSLALFSSLTDGDKLLLCPSGRLSLSCLRSSLLPLSLSPSLHLLMPLLLSQHCGALFFLHHSFYTPLFILHFLTLFISSHPFTQRIYKQTEERRRLRTTQETHRHTLTHKHKHFQKGKEVCTNSSARDQDFWDTLGTASVLDHNCWQEWCLCLCGVRRKRARAGLSLRSEPHGTPAPPDWELFRDFCSQRRDTCPLLSTSLSSRENHSAERNWPSGPWR